MADTQSRFLDVPSILNHKWLLKNAYGTFLNSPPATSQQVNVSGFTFLSLHSHILCDDKPVFGKTLCGLDTGAHRLWNTCGFAAVPMLEETSKNTIVICFCIVLFLKMGIAVLKMVNWSSIPSCTTLRYAANERQYINT